MGSKYTTQAASGYNSSPPADDGSQVASNLITWATHKTKIGDPIKTLADAINSALVTAFDYSVRQITSSDNTVASDHMKCVEIAPTVTTAVTVSLGDAVTMTNNYRVFVKNSSARNQTVSRVTGGDTIDGVAGSITLPPLSGAIFQTTTGASGYLIDSWFGPISDGTAIVAGGTDGTKKVRLEVDGLTTATTRVLTVPDRDLTIRDAAALGTKTATTSGTAVDYTSIPTWATKIIVSFSGVSTSGTDDILVQLGDSGGIETNGYVSTSSDMVASPAIGVSTSTAGFIVRKASAAFIFSGHMTLTLHDSANNTWIASHSGKVATTTTVVGGGDKSTSAALDRVRITVTGADTFDAGSVNVLYE